ncbi:MAG TPA: O-antigen ligase family protein [Anaerolineales bacterium]|nr:hypothetical protein [Chloroflexota bacterium]MBV6467804.1 hypothetical protein [Anaerolineales bacterium]MDL1927226.1 hypothetical protein [Anaerolineae bacterium AMX1]MBW7919468.1 O-antigen ligase family protein [Anaerolineales bacterium]MCZ2288712.1 O-antigen ligase family protein [Anaerolineales bacterium]
MTINKQDVIYLLLIIALASAGAVLISNPNIQVGLFGLATLLVIGLVVAIYIKPSLGAVVLIIAVFSNISRQFTDQGLPGVIKPLVAIVAATIFVRYLNESMPGGRVKTRTVEVFLFLFLIATALSYIVADNKDRALEATLDLGKDIVIIYCFLFTLRTPNTWKMAAWTIILVMGFLCLLGAYQVIRGNYRQEFFGLARVVQDIGSYSTTYRIAGSIKEPNIWGQVVVASIPLVLLRVIDESRIRIKLISLGILGILLFEVLNTYSRGAYLALAIIFVLTALSYRLHPLVWFSSMAVVVLAIPWLPSSYTARFETLSLLSPGSQGGIYQEDSFRGRTSEMLTGLSMFVNNPLLGVGAGNYPNNYQTYATNVGLELRSGERDPHSLYVQVLAETGVIGTIMFVGFSIALLVGLTRARNSISHLEEYRHWIPWIIAIQLTIIGYLITSFFLHGAYLRFFWIFSALAMSAIQLTEELRQDAERPSRELTT